MEQRPASVPSDAYWSPSDNEWILAETDADGENHGLVKYFRPDGTLCCETEFVHGTPHGSFKRFHENGQTSREGVFVEGVLHGLNTFVRCDEETSESFPAGLGQAVWRAEMDFEDGNIVGARAFDREGNRCLEDGTPFPDKPEGLPEQAHYDQEAELWVEGSRDDEHQRVGTWRWWSPEGVLVREVPYSDGEAHGQALFFMPDGKPNSRLHFSMGVLHGPAEEWCEPGHFQDETAIVERGSYIQGQPVGRWTWHDADGNELGRVIYGVPRDEDQLMQSEALVDERRSSAEWRDVAKAAKRELYLGEMLLAATRSAAQSGNFEAFEKLLRGTCKPLSEDASYYEFERAEGSIESLIGALIGGAPAADTIRQMAVVLDQREWSFAAWDLVTAAIGLAPERPDLHFTRALIGMSVGDVNAARESVDVVATDDPGRAEFLGGYLDLLFPRFDFWPAREEPSSYYDSLPEQHERTLEDVRSTIQKYATRILHIRQVLMDLGMSVDEPWMLPDLGHLLPDGPVELSYSEVEDEDGDLVDNDESLDMTGEAIPTLMRGARVEWHALCWLCWAAGLDEIALPTALNHRDNFGQAAGMASQRLWRCRDQEVTGGHMANMHDIPSFEWEGMPIDEVPGPLVGMATFQYAEMQGLFYYLTDANIASPWQDGLRGS